MNGFDDFESWIRVGNMSFTVPEGTSTVDFQITGSPITTGSTFFIGNITILGSTI
jgi:hypothetical protein